MVVTSGIGHFGKVYLARVKSPNDPFILVLKCLNKDEVIDKGVQTQVRREIEVSLIRTHMIRDAVS